MANQKHVGVQYIRAGDEGAGYPIVRLTAECSQGVSGVNVDPYVHPGSGKDVSFHWEGPSTQICCSAEDARLFAQNLIEFVDNL